MLKAGALFVSVAISFVIAVLISLLIVLAFQYKIQNRENLLQKKLERNVNSAMNLLMAGGIKEVAGEVKSIDLYGEESDSVQVKNSSWGVWEVAAVKAFSGRYSLTKTAAYGYAPDENFSGAIYLTDLSRPLNLCGKTKITGNCYLPEAGVKRGYIEGVSFEGTTLINGSTKRSKNALPVLDKEMIKKLSGYFGGNLFAEEHFLESGVPETDSLIHSFLELPLLIRLNGKGIVSGKYLSGNIVVYSDKSILVEENALLEDIILIAPTITIRKGFTGSLQAFAKDSIVVEEECKLKYPSALGLFKNDHKTSQPFIKLMKKSSLNGIVFTSQSEFVTDLHQTLVSIDKDALLTGQLYVEGFADIKGEVRGMVWCNKFLLKTKASVYENHLLDAVIDRTKLSNHYTGSGLITSGKRKRIVKWLE